MVRDVDVAREPEWGGVGQGLLVVRDIPHAIGRVLRLACLGGVDEELPGCGVRATRSRTESVSYIC